MIRLEVKDYCHDCVNFEAEVSLPETRFIPSNDPDKFLDIVHTDTIVYCKHAARCDHIMKYVVENYKEKENAGRNT